LSLYDSSQIPHLSPFLCNFVPVPGKVPSQPPVLISFTRLLKLSLLGWISPGHPPKLLDVFTGLVFYGSKLLSPPPIFPFLEIAFPRLLFPMKRIPILLDLLIQTFLPRIPVTTIYLIVIFHHLFPLLPLDGPFSFLHDNCGRCRLAVKLSPPSPLVFFLLFVPSTLSFYFATSFLSL